MPHVTDEHCDTLPMSTRTQTKWTLRHITHEYWDTDQMDTTTHAKWALRARWGAECRRVQGIGGLPGPDGVRVRVRVRVRTIVFLASIGGSNSG